MGATGLSVVVLVLVADEKMLLVLCSGTNR